jgi:hypothetical protein
MVPEKNVIIGMIVLALFAGCLKKKVDRDGEFSSSTKTATATTPAASQDIFDEFYKEDSGAAKASKSEPVVRSSPAGPPSFSENGRFVVQVSTLPSRSLADAVSEKLSAKGYPSYVAEVYNPTPALSGTYYRVRIGGFTGVSLARSFGENYLVADGYDFWVDNRSNDNVGLDGSGMGSGSGSFYGTSTPDYGTSTPATTDYQSSSQSSYESSYQSTPVPEPAPAYESSPPPAPAAAETQPATPPPASPPSPKTSTQSEWGNSDDW